jgi:hypothetical protein
MARRMGIAVIDWLRQFIYRVKLESPDHHEASRAASGLYIAVVSGGRRIRLTLPEGPPEK